MVACNWLVEVLERAQLYARDGLFRFADKGVISEDAAESAYGRIDWTVSLQDLRDAERPLSRPSSSAWGAKKEALGALDALLLPGSLILINISSISITDLASATGRVASVCGTHFFIPSPLREAVEVPRGLLTSYETVERMKELVTSFSPKPVLER